MNFSLNYYHTNAKEDQISFSFGVYDGEECKAYGTILAVIGFIRPINSLEY